MKKISYVVALMSLLFVLAGCEMPFPSEEPATEEPALVQPTAVSPDATPLPDGSGSTDPNVGGGAPDMAPPTDEPTAEPVESTVEPIEEPTEEPAVVIDPVVPTATTVPPTETAVPPTIAPTPTAEPTVAPIPPTTAPHRTHTVAPGENLYRISLQYGLSWTEVAAANGITNPDNITVGQTLIIPGEGTVDSPVQGGTHVVQANQNLYYIGLLYGLPWTTIAEANGITDPNAIYAGQILIIPSQ